MQGMPTSLSEHFDALWIATTVVLGFGLALIIYFIRVWKNTVDEDIKILKDKSSTDDLNLIRLYVSKEECRMIEQAARETVKDIRTTIDSIEEKIDGLGKRVDEYHLQLMYELGIRNGKQKAKRGDERGSAS